MKIRIILLIITLLLPAASLQAAITSVTLTPASPTTLSNGNSYYLAGRQYIFRVQAVDVLATDQSYWDDITITFPAGGETFTISIDTDSVVGTPTGIVVDLIANNTSVYTNIDYSITIRFLWTATGYNAGANDIEATVSNDNPQSVIDTETINHGLCTSIRAVNFAQSGVAADGYINRYHSAFNVTGTIVYNVTGATAADTVESKDPGEINAATDIDLYRSGTATSANSLASTENFNFPITAASIAAQAAVYTWEVRVTMITGSAIEPAVNTLPLVCDNIRITSITFSGGGGVTAAPTYYRSVNVPNTQVTVQATKQYTGGSMIGATVITISDVPLSTSFTVTIADNATSGTANVNYPALAQTPVGQTTPLTYQVTAISGSVFDNEQNAAARITQPANPVILWDRNDPPGRNGPAPNYDDDDPGVGQTPFTTMGATPVTVTAINFTLNWTALSTSGGPPYDADFDTYRIYYRREGTTEDWLIVDETVTGYANLGSSTTTSALITNLVPLNNYYYFITAVDVFGQEVGHPVSSTFPPAAASPSITTSDAAYQGAPTAYGFGQLTTLPTSIEVTATDSITQYTNTQFQASLIASTRPLRKSSIRITPYIVTVGVQPDSVNIIIAQDNGSGSSGSDLVIGTALNGSVQYDKIACSKSAPNTWLGYIPSDNRFLLEGQSCRFIIESIKNSIATYNDANAGDDPNDFEWTFSVSTPTRFTPWPTRILNNVITDKNPVCYPSYYLSANAYVTITVYDIKGRPVATIIDDGFRKGGQNIKEGGWSGKNKARKKLGAGLYYMHFQAKRASDGKIILNEKEKIVIAK